MVSFEESAGKDAIKRGSLEYQGAHVSFIQTFHNLKLFGAILLYSYYVMVRMCLYFIEFHSLAMSREHILQRERERKREREKEI
jgi:hypothetical protein